MIFVSIIGSLCWSSSLSIIPTEKQQCTSSVLYCFVWCGQVTLGGRPGSVGTQGDGHCPVLTLPIHCLCNVRHRWTHKHKHTEIHHIRAVHPYPILWDHTKHRNKNKHQANLKKIANFTTSCFYLLQTFLSDLFVIIISHVLPEELFMRHISMFVIECEKSSAVAVKAILRLMI